MLRSQGESPPESESVLDPAEIQHLQELTRRVHVETEVIEYAVNLCRHTRQNARVLLGASPRASLSLLKAAKSCAILAGRTFATPDDVRVIAGAVLAHRLILVPDLDGDDEVRRQVLDEALAKVPYSRAAI
jgi:MoxR-like ATPase